jgi:CHAT domain-containing protein/tetratricopeptide (TPR) repeat protein
LDENLQGHLGTVELARLLEQSRLREDLATPIRDLHPHLAVCTSCREQLEELVLFDRKLKSVNRPGAPAPEPNCPVPAIWREVAGGLTPPLQTLGYIEHASRCNSCGPSLRQAIVDLNGLSQGLSEAEKQYIATLESSNPEWRQGLASRITRTPPSDRKSAMGWSRWLSAPRLTIAGVSLLGIIIAVSWVLVRRNQPPNAERLLARAYTQTRTLELRIAGADYAPLRISRGPQASFASRSRALLKAEALIATQLRSHPSDPAWLQAKAQADLLEGKYDAAAEALRRALELEPHSPSVLTDLATAYFQRGQQEDKKDDFGAAYELLSQALRLRPDDPVALFNRAIVAEHQFLYRQALDDWDHYLRVDPTSQWKEEARNHANSVREIIKQHGRKATPLLSPAGVIAARASPSAGAEVDERIEEYLHEAVVSWLPQTFPESNSDAAKALFFLAELSQQRHRDRWLSDLLRKSSAPHFPQAVTALARAVKANDAGEYDVSHQQAELAEKLFRASGSATGVLRAKFERTFSEQLTRRSEACRRRATAGLAESEKYSYSWLQIQFGLEESVCSSLMGDIGTDEKAARRAQDLARKTGYAGLYLRAALFAADNKLATGNQAGASTIASMGLARYWTGEFPALRGYNLYAGLADIAEAAGRPNLELAIWGEAVALIDTDEDLLLRAVAHNWMANAAMTARLPQEAEKQYAEFARLFAAAPHTEANRNDGLQAEIRTAQLEAQQGRSDDAIAHLTGIQDQIRPLSNNYLVQMFYSTLGELQVGRHREAEAEQALRPALALAEQNLKSLGSDAERASWSKNASPAYLALVEAELVQGRSEDALETYEWYLGAPLRVFANKRPRRAFISPTMPDRSRLASRLPVLTKETVLTYAVLPDGLAIWVYDDRGINTRWIPKSTDGLQELAERFRDLASDPSSELSALRRDARSLYGSLIAPVEQHLAPGRTLVIEADGWLARVPFEALLDSNDHYLIERASIVHSLGQDSQAQLRNGTGISADMPAFVFGSTASSAADGLIPLPDVAEEADTVARGFHSPRVFEGGEATLDAVRRELPQASVFHFAGHSLAAPQGTGLLLESGDRKTNTPRLMDANVVRQLRLQNLQLAVLSACSTASGGTGSNGFDSVTDALLRAGAPHVVASRWAVDSAETRGFVQDFYRSALSGHTVSEAIRLTSRNMMANPRTSHPYYWSAFAAYGRP